MRYYTVHINNSCSTHFSRTMGHERYARISIISRLHVNDTLPLLANVPACAAISPELSPFPELSTFIFPIHDAERPPRQRHTRHYFYIFYDGRSGHQMPKLLMEDTAAMPRYRYIHGDFKRMAIRAKKGLDFTSIFPIYYSRPI